MDKKGFSSGLRWLFLWILPICPSSHPGGLLGWHGAFFLHVFHVRVTICPASSSFHRHMISHTVMQWEFLSFSPSVHRAGDVWNRVAGEVLQLQQEGPLPVGKQLQQHRVWVQTQRHAHAHVGQQGDVCLKEERLEDFGVYSGNKKQKTPEVSRLNEDIVYCFLSLKGCLSFITMSTVSLQSVFITAFHFPSLTYVRKSKGFYLFKRGKKPQPFPLLLHLKQCIRFTAKSSLSLRLWQNIESSEAVSLLRWFYFFMVIIPMCQNEYGIFYWA